MVAGSVIGIANSLNRLVAKNQMERGFEIGWMCYRSTGKVRRKLFQC